MRKTLISVLLFFIASTTFAQERLSFEKVIAVDSLSMSQIYIQLKEWIGMNYVSAKSVIEVDDKEEGLIIFSPLKEYTYGRLLYEQYRGNIKYSVKLQIKDNRFKATVTNFMHDNLPGYNQLCSLGIITTVEEYQGKTNLGEKKMANNVWNDLKRESEAIAIVILNNLEGIEFVKSVAEDKSEDW